jgi:hypothetical protein
MALVTRTTGVEDVAQLLAAQPEAIRQAAETSIKVLVQRAADRVVELTTERYNLDADTVREFVTLGGPGDGSARASLTLKVRAIGIEAFKPEIRMVRFSGPDKLGRRYANRELPEVRLARLRGGTPKRVTGAFPLRQRTPGALQGGDDIRRRTGTAREKLTRIRFFTFPRKFVREALLPAIRATVTELAGIEVREAFRRFRRGRTQLTNR